MVFTCNLCQKEYKTIMGLNQHQLRNPDCNKPFECKNCKYVTMNKSHYTRHLGSNKCRNIKTNYTCIHCNKSFTDNRDLTRHMNRKNPCYNAIQTVNNITNMNNSNNTTTTTMTNSNNTNYNIMNVNLNSLSDVDKLLYKEVMLGKNIEDFKTQFIEAVESNTRPKIKKLYKLYGDETPEELEEIEEAHNNNVKVEETKYLQKIIEETIFKDITSMPPIYKSSRSSDIGIKHDNTLVQLDNKSIDIITSLLHVEDQLGDDPLRINIATMREQLAEKYQLNRSRYYEELIRYYEEDKQIRHTMRMRNVR